MKLFTINHHRLVRSRFVHLHPLFFMILFFIPTILSANSRSIPQSEAMNLVYGTTGQSGYDFYIGSVNSNQTYSWGDSTEIASRSYWMIFVDKEPMKGWEHDCTLFRVPRILYRGETLSADSISLRLPPNGLSLSVMNVANPYGQNVSQTITVNSNSNYTPDPLVASHTYAMIISGGVAPASNHERYWNDCSYIYQVLRNKYGVPKANIKVFMSDGTSPGADMRKADGSGFVSSPTDLDSDGIADINGAATKTNISNGFSNFANNLSEDDHLFVFVIDHGGSVDGISNSYICLWNNEKLYDYELDNMLDNIDAGYMSVVLGQCFSGGFVDNLAQTGRVIMTACSGNEYSYGCSDRPYDEFVYWWTKAMAEKTPESAGLSLGFYPAPMTMDFAFEYASQQDRRSETPQYSSTPLSIGEDLSFDYIPEETICLYIPDALDDTGKEPYEGEDPSQSPNIWIRNQNDGFEVQEHETPYVENDEKDIWIYVRIFNRGTEDYPANGNKYCKIYWTEAALNTTQNTWRNQPDGSQNQAYGSIVDGWRIDSIIPAGGSRIFKKKWTVSKSLATNLGAFNNRLHTCFLAMVDDSRFDIAWPPGIGNTAGTRKYRRMAQRNTTIFFPSDLAVTNNIVKVYVKNPSSYQSMYDIEVKAPASTTLFDDAEVSIDLNPLLKSAWDIYGNNSYHITRYPSMPNKVYFNDTQSKLFDIEMESLDMGSFDVKLDFLANNPTSEDYEFSILLRDQDTGVVAGSQGFIIHRGPTANLQANVSVGDDGKETVLVLEGDEKDVAVEWLNDQGAVVGEGKTMPSNIKTLGGVSRVRLRSLKDGSICYLPVAGHNTGIIEKVKPNEEGTFVNILLGKPALENSTVFISDKDGKEQHRIQVEKGMRQVSIPCNLKRGAFYIVSYVVDGEKVDSKSILFK